MFCPKCGIKNPDDGKFCRKCGTDLSPISEALTGKSLVSNKNEKNKKVSWESAMGKLFMGLAFMTVAIILGVTNAAAGRNWWFWLLIPAFAMLGAGVAQVLQIREIKANNSISDFSDDKKQIVENPQTALPPTQTDYVSPINKKHYNTGDLVPPSVVENTTRHLEMDSEGKTMTLPEDKI